jgi:LysR family transcriptional regulator, hypochlorite-specific transcription factor HypT
MPLDILVPAPHSNAKVGFRHARSASTMELNWLEDFRALAEHRNFSRAAEARHVTQPAFSRRIRALEAWVGTQLVIRAPGGVVLNAAGEALLERAAGLVSDLHHMRRAALKAAGRAGAALTIAATHALSFTFFPTWIRSFAPLETMGTLNLVSDTMAACERILLAGDADFLLCHVGADAPAGLPPEAFESVVVGTDLLVPVSAPDAAGAARWMLPGRPAAPARLLAYSAVSGLGRIIEANRRAAGEALSLDTVFTSPLAATLQTMARQGHGLAWLPRTMAAEDLAAGRLVGAGGGSQSIALEIRLFRPRRRQSNAAEAFWQAMRPSASPM